METAAAIALAYLWGGVPTAYLLVRWTRGQDIRDLGSGNVGASNVVASFGLMVGLALGAFDAAVKGTLPVVVVALLGRETGLQIAVGAAAVVGHNWSPFIRFTGGRGIAAALGAYFGLGLIMWPQLLMVLLVAGGWGWYLRKNLAFWMAVAMGAVPVMAWLLGQPDEVVFGSLAVLAILLAKRLTGNWERPPEGEPLPRVLANRLLYDRDVSSNELWVHRGIDRETGDRGG